MEELFLSRFFTGDKLNIVHQQHIDAAIFFAKRLGRVTADRVDQVGGEGMFEGIAAGPFAHHGVNGIIILEAGKHQNFHIGEFTFEALCGCHTIHARHDNIHQYDVWLMLLAQDHSLFAYDLAWEPHFEGVEDRSRYTKEWNEWIHKKHGSLEKAFKAWNHKAELKDGQVPVPQSREWYEKGPWDAMALDYGDFLNDLLERHYSHARDLVRGIDPNHAVSFRMQHAGDPTYWGPTWIPYDFRGVARGVDILEPEAYGRIGDWEQVKGGIFTVDYGRAVAPELPVFWAEAGYTSWNMSTMDNPPKNLEVVASFYRHFHRMLIESHSNGIAFWWFPGGFRANENSDFGILNPDGTDRPVTKVIREMGPQVVNLGAHPSPTLVKGTKRTGIRLFVEMSFPLFSTSVSVCTKNGVPTGMIIFPSSFSCSTSGGGMCSAAAVTTMASNGPFSFQP